MENHPLVSISVLTYNHGSYIADCLDGILAQKCDFRLEILIHDDASTDDTQDIIKNYAENFPDIIKPIYQRVNQYTQGKQLSVNNFQRALGDYIAICDGDDVWTDHYKLQKQLDFLTNNETFVVSYTDAVIVGANGEKLQFTSSSPTRDATPFELGTGFNIHTSSSVFRNVMGNFPHVLMSCPIGDLAFWAYLSRFGAGKFSSDCRPIKYRVHDQSMFSTLNQKQRAIDIGITFLLISKFHLHTDSHEMTRRTMFLGCFYVLKSLGPQLLIEFSQYILLKTYRYFQKLIMK